MYEEEIRRWVSVRIDSDNNDKKIWSVNNACWQMQLISVFKHSVGRQDGREGLTNFFTRRTNRACEWPTTTDTCRVERGRERKGSISLSCPLGCDKQLVCYFVFCFFDRRKVIRMSTGITRRIKQMEGGPPKCQFVLVWPRWLIFITFLYITITTLSFLHLFLSNSIP